MINFMLTHLAPYMDRCEARWEFNAYDSQRNPESKQQQLDNNTNQYQGCIKRKSKSTIGSRDMWWTESQQRNN